MPQHNRHKPLILLTGFGPFLTVAENATSTVVPAVAKAVAAQLPQLHCVAEILPTDWIQAPARFDELVREHAPGIILQFGVSPRAKGFVIETRGRNARQASVDASGCKPSAARIVGHGPKFIDTSVPVKLVLDRLHALGLRATRSHSAGQYVCNALLYHGLYCGLQASQSAEPEVPPPMIGFVHLPVKIPASAGSAKSAARTLTLDRTIAGSVAIVAACHEKLERMAC